MQAIKSDRYSCRTLCRYKFQSDHLVACRPNLYMCYMVSCIRWPAEQLINKLCYRAARMSLIFSIIRLSDPSYPLRKPANMTAGFFACCWIGILLLKVLICRDIKAWRDTAVVACDLGESVAIIELCGMPHYLVARRHMISPLFY